MLSVYTNTFKQGLNCSSLFIGNPTMPKILIFGVGCQIDFKFRFVVGNEWGEKGIVVPRGLSSLT
jgi:hypothetical protein